MATTTSLLAGSVNLSFDAATIGIPVADGQSYALLHRSGVTGQFSAVATAAMASGVLSFSHLPDDGVYTIGKKGTVNLSIDKAALTVRDPINLFLNPKSIPGSNTDYTLTVRNNGNGSPFIFTDNHCPPTTATLTSDLTLDHLNDVAFKDTAGNPLTPAAEYDQSVSSFEITLSGTMNTTFGE